MTENSTHGNIKNPARQEMARIVQKSEQIINLGCRLNISEGNHIAAILAQNPEKYADVMVVNSCAVTKQAERKSLQAARKLKRDNPDKKIIFTGCAAQISPEKFQKIPQIDAVIGNDKKLQLDKIDLNHMVENPPAISDIFGVTETALHLLESYRYNHSRAFMQIQNGCDHRCTFCIIPYGRGNSRSLPPHEIIQQVKQLIKENIKEIVLTGVDLTSYFYEEDSQKKWSLGMLVQEILNKVPELPRLRISSLDCIEIDELLKSAFTCERLMPHLHLSLQSGDNLILKRMKRRHNREQAIELCQQLREIRPDIVFGADIIAGFPTETDAHFAQSCAMIEECDLTWLHVFPFSPREGTPAARMKQLDGTLIRKRAYILREMATKATQHYMQSCVGQNLPILLESPIKIADSDGQYYSGYSPHFAETIIAINDSSDEESWRGKMVMVDIKAVKQNKLQGILKR